MSQKIRGEHEGCNYLGHPGWLCEKCGKMVPHDLESLQAEMDALKQRLEAAEKCSTCYGTLHASGKVCVCGGTNRREDEVRGLRVAVLESEQRLEVAERERSEAKRELRDLLDVCGCGSHVRLDRLQKDRDTLAGLVGELKSKYSLD